MCIRDRAQGEHCTVLTNGNIEISPGLATPVDDPAQGGPRTVLTNGNIKISPGLATPVDDPAQGEHSTALTNGNIEISPGLTTPVDDPAQTGHCLEGQVGIAVYKVQHQKVAVPSVFIFCLEHLLGAV